jgi:hypothetical protein
VVGLQGDARLGGLRLGILDGLGFVEHRVAEAGLREQVGMAPELAYNEIREAGARVLDETVHPP